MVKDIIYHVNSELKIHFRWLDILMARHSADVEIYLSGSDAPATTSVSHYELSALKNISRSFVVGLLLPPDVCRIFAI